MNPLVADLFLYLGALLPAVLYVVVYSRSPWSRSMVGRDLMALSVVMALALALAAARAYLGPDWTGRQILRVGIYVVLAVVLWHRLILLVRIQRHPDPQAKFGPRGPRRRRDDHPAKDVT